MPLQIAVCIKPVPDSKYYDKISIDPKTKTWDRSGIPMVIGDLDKNALEAALVLREKFQGKISVFSMAPEFTREVMVQALAMGADEAFLLSDRSFAGADTLATSYTLASAIKKAGNFDLVLTGNESDDGSTGQVSPQLGEWLGFPHLMNVVHLDFDGELLYVDTLAETGIYHYQVKLPAVIAVTRKVNKPRLIGVMGLMKAKAKPLNLWTAVDLGADANRLGLKGSPTQPGDMVSPDTNRKAERIDGSPEDIADRIIVELRKAGIIG